MPRQTAPILTLLPLDGKAGSVEIDPENIVMGKITTKDANIFFNFRYRHEGKMYPLKIHFPILPCRMYEKYNTDYNSYTRKATIRLIRDQMDEEDFELIVTKINDIQDRMDKVFAKAMEKQLESNPALAKAKKVVDPENELEKLEDLLFYYDKDKEGNLIDNPEDRQFFSIKIEPNRDWLVPKIKLLGQQEDKPLENTFTYTDDGTGEKTEYPNLSPSQLEWFHLLGTRTESSCVVNFDSYLVRTKGKGVDFHRRVYLAVNSIADFVENENDDGAAEAAVELFGDSEKVNRNLDEKFSMLSKFMPGGDTSESGVAIENEDDSDDDSDDGDGRDSDQGDDSDNESVKKTTKSTKSTKRAKRTMVANTDDSNEDDSVDTDSDSDDDGEVVKPPTRTRRNKKNK